MSPTPEPRKRLIKLATDLYTGVLTSRGEVDHSVWLSDWRRVVTQLTLSEHRRVVSEAQKRAK